MVDEWYHLYSRGNDRRVIFNDNNDYLRFLKLLYTCNSSKSITLKTIPDPVFTFDRGETSVEIGAYCLMPNHFHLLIKGLTENGISLFMQKLLTGYSMYFNIKNQRTGKLFDGVFRSVHIEDDRYFRYLMSYIHLNPVKLVEPKWKEEGIKDIPTIKTFLKNYYPSSFVDYANSKVSPRNERSILSLNNLPIEFGRRDFETELTDWLEYQTMLK